MITKEILKAAEKRLTPKQRSVLECLLQGKSNGDIKRELYSEHAHDSTVSKLISAICKAFDEELAKRGEPLQISNDKGASYRLRDELIELYVRYEPNHPALNPTLLKRQAVELEAPDYPVSPESRFYIERPPLEVGCCEALAKPGALLRIRAPKQMGKSSLMNRLLNDLANRGSQVVFWSLAELDRDVLGSLEQLLKSFCWEISRQLEIEKLEIEAMIADCWDSPASQKIKCSDYFQNCLLPRIEGSLVLALDDVDCLFFQRESADFFTMLRKWHEKGGQQKVWQKLSLVLAYSTEDYAQLDLNQSPFNVGSPIKLPEFTLPQMQDLAAQHGLNWGIEPGKEKARGLDYSLTALRALVGGHPYLVRLAMYAVAQGDLTVERLLQEALTDAGIYNPHLRRHWDVLRQRPDLAAAMKQVVMADEPVVLNPGQKFKLQSMGLIEFRGNEVVPSCRLYRDYFRRVL